MAFEGCSSLKTAKLLANVVRIGQSTFAGCSALVDVTFGDVLNVIDDGAFSECGSLKGITIPGSVTRVGKLAFAECGVLSDVTFNEGTSAADIDDEAFKGCKGLKTVAMHANIVRIGQLAFAECKRLSKVTFGEGLVDIDDNAFSVCMDLKSVNLPSTVVRIGEAAFSMCSSMTNLSLNVGLRRIESMAFAGCMNIEAVTIPDSVVYIGSNAFGGCMKLKDLTISSSVVDIGNGVFSACTGIETVRAPYALKAQIEDDLVFVGCPAAVIYYYAGSSYTGSPSEVVAPFAKAQVVNGALYDHGGGLAGTVQLKVGKASSSQMVKVSATVTRLNGKKVIAKAKSMKLTGERLSDTLMFNAPVGEMKFAMAADGSLTLSNSGYVMAAATIGGALSSGNQGYFVLEDAVGLSVPGTLQADLLPTEEVFKVTNGKWKFAKNATVKLVQGQIVQDTSNGKTNRASLRLNYTAKTGLFKGTFKVYALETVNGKPKLKKLTANVTGLVVNGVGTGTATLKKPAAGSWTVTIE